MKKLNKKAFTLVELLAVIVILAVVMLMAVTAVGPLMAKSRKSALGTEGVALVNAAKTAYQAEQMGGGGAITNTSTVCFSLEWLKQNGYFEKGSSDGYTGSVLITYVSGGSYTYSFWIGNKTYFYAGVNPNKYSQSNAYEGDSTSNTCQSYDTSTKKYGSDQGTVKCTYDSTSSKSTCA